MINTFRRICRLSSNLNGHINSGYRVASSQNRLCIQRSPVGSTFGIAENQRRNYIILHNQNCLQSSPGHTSTITIKRFKKRRSRATDKDNDEDEADDEDDEELANENPLLVDDLLGEKSDGSQTLTIDIGTLRLDAFVKAAFGMTRNKAEELFYKGDIYVNGERPLKKSSDVSLNDEIDVVKGVNMEDNNKIDIRRVVVVNMPDKATEQGRMKITIKRWFELTVDAPNKGNKDDD